VVTRAVRERLGFDATVIDAGLREPTAAETLDVGASPGGDVRNPEPVPEAGAIFDRAREIGADATADRLLLAETIPGGTTTAMGVLSALGERAAVSSSLADNPLERKRAVVEEGLAASDVVPGDLAGSPLEAIRRMGDPVLAALAGVVMAVYAASVAAILVPGTPAPDDWRARLTTSFPAAMTIEEAGERLDAWVADWREEGRLSGYDWLNWTAEHSRTPWTSLETMGTWLIEDGYPGEGHRLQKRAAALRPETESP
jgi:hypothetical protein